ncbi:MAG TPA: hypothetical protein VLC73_11890, partial [Burkholderiales bacterium]|nr:hypothetical protein [Burkholderiales bacterium]
MSSVAEEFVAQKIQRDFAPVGTIVSSVLAPAEFATATGEKLGDTLDKRRWILADGIDVRGTKYAILTDNKPIPNLQGMFLRGMDLKSKREVGSLEKYATALPVENKFAGKTSTDGAHEHPNGASASTVDRY